MIAVEALRDSSWLPAFFFLVFQVDEGGCLVAALSDERAEQAANHLADQPMELGLVADERHRPVTQSGVVDTAVVRGGVPQGDQEFDDRLPSGHRDSALSKDRVEVTL